MKKLSKKNILMLALCFLAFGAAALAVTFWGRNEIRSTFAYEYDYTKPAGSGTEADPYLITTESEFYYITQELDKFYRLEADLTFEDYVPICTTDYTADVLGTEEKNPAYAFKGTFDGGNHRIAYTVSDEFYNRKNPGYIGLFGEIYGEAVIKDLVVEAHIGDEYTYQKGTYVGGLVGLVHGYSKGGSSGCSGSKPGTYYDALITGVTIAEESYIKGSQYVGGIVGAKRGSTVENCKVYGTVYGNSGAGGIVGYSRPLDVASDAKKTTLIKDSENYALVQGNVMVGGIIGNAYGEGENSYIQNTFNRGTSQFVVESTSGASNNYEYWGDVYGYQAKDLTDTRITMQDSGSKTTLNIKGNFSKIEGFQASEGVTFDKTYGTGETTVTATAKFVGTLGMDGSKYYGCVSNYSGAYFRITRDDGKYVYVSVLDRTTASFRHTIDVDLDKLTAYDPGELSDPASVEKTGTTVTIKTASALEHFAWVSNGYIYDEAIGSDPAGTDNDDATGIPKNIIHLTGESYDLTQSVGVWGEVAAGENGRVSNRGKGHPNFYGIGATTFAPFIGGLEGHGAELKVYLNCPEGSFIGVLGAVSSNAGGVSADASTTTLYDLTVRGVIRGKNKVGVVGFHDNYAPATLYNNDRESTVEIKNVENYADVSGSFYVGGILGASNSSSSKNTPKEARVLITNCHNYGDVSGTYRVGGVVGALATNVATAADMDNVTNHGNVFATDFNDGRAYNLQMAESVGGIVGSVRDHINVNGAVENYGDVTLTGTGRYAGGLVGYTEYGFLMGKNGSLLNEGRVAGFNYTGGIIGYAAKYHESCVYLPSGTVNRSEVTGNQYVGGLIGAVVVGDKGVAGVKISGNYSNEAEVRGTYAVGGLFGTVQATSAEKDEGIIDFGGNMTNTGKVVMEGVSETIASSNAGGIVGYLYGRKNITITGELVNRGEIVATTRYAGATGDVVNTATDLNAGGLFGYVLINTKEMVLDISADLINEAPVSGRGVNEEFRNVSQRVGGVAGYINLTAPGKIDISGKLQNSADVEGEYYVGGLFGSVSGALNVTGTASNAEGTSVNAVFRAGGFAGYLSGVSLTLENGFVNNMAINVSGQGYAGGLFGSLEYSTAAEGVDDILLSLGTVENRGEISAPNEYNEYGTGFNSRVGGVAGYLYSSIYGVKVTGNVTNTADITVAGERIGGLFGHVSVAKNLGGTPVQYAQKFLTFEGNFENSGKLSGTSSYANSNYMGGILGALDGSLRVAEGSAVLNSGDIVATGTTTFGGIVGSVTYSNADCSAVFDGNATNLGNIYAENASTVGGIIGTLSGNSATYIKTVFLGGKGKLLNEGDILGQGTIGGIFGNVSRTNGGSVEIDFAGGAENRGEITGKSGTVGGLGGNVGLSNTTKEIGSLTLSGTWTNTGAVSGAGSNVGGNIGYVNWNASNANVPAEGGKLTFSGDFTNTGSVTNPGSYTGGNVGNVYVVCRVADQIKVSVPGNFRNEGELNCSSYAGGVFGYFYSATASSSLEVSGSIENSGTVTKFNGGSVTGGIFGKLGNTSTLKMKLTVAETGRILNEAKIVGQQYTAGIAGQMYGDFAVNGLLENRGEISGTTDVGGIFGFADGSFAADSEGETASRGSVTGTSGTNVALFLGRTQSADAVPEAANAKFAAYVTLGLGAKVPGISITVGETVYTTDESGIFRDASGDALTLALGGYEVNKYTTAGAEHFAKTLAYTYEESSATFTAGGFTALSYPLTQSVKIVKGVDVVGSVLNVAGVTKEPWKFTVTTVYYDGTAAEGSVSVSLDAAAEIEIQPGQYLYSYQKTVEVAEGTSVEVDLTLQYVPAEVVAYLDAYKALNAVGGVSGVVTTGNANFVSRYEKAVAALTAFESIPEAETPEERAFLEGYLANSLETANTVNLAAGKTELYAWTDATLDLKYGEEDGKNEKGYKTGFVILQSPQMAHYGNTTAGAYETVLGVYTLTNSGTGRLVSAGVTPEGTESGYYRVAMPMTFWYSAYEEKISAAQFSRAFTLYSGSTTVFTIPTSQILTTAGLELFAERVNGISVEKEELDLKLGLNTSYQTFVTMPAAGGTYSVYVGAARGNFKNSVKDPEKPTTNTADAWLTLFQLSADGGETWLDGAANFTTQLKWTTTGRYSVKFRLMPEGKRLVNYAVTLNGTPLTEQNGYETEITLDVTAASVALKWSPVGGEPSGTAGFLYTGSALGYAAVFDSTAYSYRLKYTITDQTGESAEGNTAIDAGTYTIRAYAVYKDGTPVPESVLTLTNSVFTLTIGRRPLTAADVDIDPIPAQKYTGEPREPGTVIEWNGILLEQGRDYTLSYENNVESGTAKVKITFVGNYEGSAETSFVISSDYRVSFDSAGGSRVLPVLAAEGEAAQKPDDPIREGYTFVGWFRGDSATAYDFSTPVTEDFTLTAHWTPVSYTIVYETGAGEGEENPSSYTIESDFELNAPALEGHTFVGWYDQNGEPVDRIQPGRTGNLVLTAEYAKNKYTVTLTGNAPAYFNGVPYEKPISFAYGTTVTLTFGNPEGGAVMGVRTETALERVGDMSFRFTVGTQNISVELAVAVIEEPADAVYSGERILPEMKISEGGKPLQEGADYTLEYGENIHAGEGTVTVLFAGEYACTVTKTFAIARRDINAEAVVDSILYRIYNGEQHRPELGVSWQGTALVAGRDFEYVYGRNLDAGEGTVTVNFNGDFAGSVTRTFRIARTAAIGANASAIDDQILGDEPIEPNFEVRMGDILLSPGTDFTVAYFDNESAGLARAVVTFKKNYIGTLVVTFRIVEPEVEEPEPEQPPAPEPEPEQPELPEETSALPAFLLPERRSY